MNVVLAMMPGRDALFTSFGDSMRAEEQRQGQHETTELIGDVNTFVKLPGMITPNDQYFSSGWKQDHTTR